MLQRLIIVILLLSQLLLFADSTTLQLNNNIEKVKANTEQSMSDYATSVDGQYLLGMREQSKVLELLNASDLSLIKAIPIEEMVEPNNKIDFVFSASTRQSFIVGIGSSNQLLEILYEDNPLPVYNGVMHDYRLGEGLVRDQSYFPVRIIKPAGKTSIPISSYYFYSVKGFLFIARDKTIEVIQLDARQTIATIILDDIPNLAISRVKTINDTPHLLVPFLNILGVTSITMDSWTATEAKESIE